MKENLLCATGAKDFQPYEFSAEFKKPAFSLVEMLMALLVASLLLAALAPVMTRRMADHELKVLSEAANYDKDLVVSVFTKDTDFNIPSDANQVRVTLMGGGGKGGDALYGNKVFTSNETFTVPDGVTKLRVFMIGGGGGGASGGMGNSTAYGNVPAIGSTAHTITTAGTYIFPNTATVPDTHVAPALHHYCEKYGTTGKWVVKSDGTTQLAAGAKIPKIDSTATVNLTKFTACGAGGGGGYLGGGGGSGGYIVDKTLSTSTIASNITLKIGTEGGSGTANSGSGTAGSGGAGGGTGGAAGGGSGLGHNGENGNGGSGGDSRYGGNLGGSAGGGGGGTAILSSGTVISEIGGGGGGGGTSGSNVSTSSHSGGGGGGGGYGSGGGGAGGYLIFTPTVGCSPYVGTAGNSDGTRGFVEISLRPGYGTSTYPPNQGGNGYGGGGGGGGSAYNDDTYGSTSCTASKSGTAANGTGGGGSGLRQGAYQAYAYGGGGGSGTNGKGGSGGPSGVGGTITTAFGANNCNGGNAGTAGKPGAMKITYTVNSVLNGLQCNYYAPSNGGGGGGAGQIWIGEINVTPNQVINLKIGQGGAVQNIGAENGNDGESTSITVGSNTYSVSGGKGGKYEGDSTYIGNTGGLGGGIKTNNFSSSAVYKDWLKLNEKVTGGLTGGTNGGQGYLETSAQNGAGGGGGSTLKMDGTVALGGMGGTDSLEGTNASAENYGAGGGGGAGGADGNFGAGGKGSGGYIYVEWGGSNASGGTIGEFVQTTVTNLDPDPKNRTMKIRIGRGGGITSTSAEDDPDLFTSSVLGSDGNGGETSISIISGNKTVTHKARGGLKGNNGGSESGNHGADKLYPDNYSDLYKEYVQSNMSTAITSGQKGEDDYGGMGGYLSCLYQTKNEEGNKVCSATVKANDGNNAELGPIRPGCGGSSIVSPLYNAICNAKSTTASPDGGNGILGAGGGGGAVLNQTGGIGGNGGNGFVILEYKSTTLD